MLKDGKINDKVPVVIGKTIERKKFSSELVFGDKYLKTKIKSYIGKITRNFHGKAPKEGIECVCLSAIVTDSIFKLGKNYYPQTFLEECKYRINEKEIKSLIKGYPKYSSGYDSEEEGNF